MTQRIELKAPCPDCRGRLTLSVRHTPLLGWHAVRLACENGCSLRRYCYDLPNGRAWFPAAEQCADWHDGSIRRYGDETGLILSLECPDCGERPQVSDKVFGRQRFPNVSCRCTSRWGADLHEAACEWSDGTGAYRRLKRRWESNAGDKDGGNAVKGGRSTCLRTKPDCPFCGGLVFLRVTEIIDDDTRRWGFSLRHDDRCELRPLFHGLHARDTAQEMAEDLDGRWSQAVVAIKGTPDCPRCGRPPVCVRDHADESMWFVGCGECGEPGNGKADDILEAMRLWRANVDEYLRTHGGVMLQNQLTALWERRARR